MSEKFTVLSPWAEANAGELCGLSPRLDSLEGRTIGLFANFKRHSSIVLKIVAAELGKRFGGMSFKEFEYPVATTEVADDPEWSAKFRLWLQDCDAVISAYGDDGSSTFYNGINTAAIERLGVPTVSIVKDNVLGNAVRGGECRMVPNLRCVSCSLADLSLLSSSDSGAEEAARPLLLEHIDGIIEALTLPLSTSERFPPPKTDPSAATFTGSIEELSKVFYTLGFTNGTPFIPPTLDAVNNMLRGTDLPRDTVLGVLPPRLGKITVEKLAVNAVMAGCLPTMFPLVIAIAKAMADPRLSLVGWQCSMAGFAPMIIVNGPIRRDIALNSTENVLSPYYLANTSLARALFLLTLNVAGIRPGVEDRAYGGHEARGGVCFGEDEENSPWEPYHVGEGFDAQDSTVTLVWFQNRSMLKGSDNVLLNMKMLCSLDDIGFNPGATLILSHSLAKTFAEAGFSKSDVINYVCEYARKSAADAPIRWLRANNHLPETAALPMDDSFSVRKFWDPKYLHIVVSTGGGMPRGCAMLGGGDHGGPVTVKVELPRNWSALVEEYKDWNELKYV